MGYEHMQLRVIASVSRHNSLRDAEHDALWDDLCARVQAIVKDPIYRAILAEVDHSGRDE